MADGLCITGDGFAAEGFDLAGVVALFEAFLLDDGVGHLAGGKHFGEDFFADLFGDDAFVDDLGQCADVGGRELTLAYVEGAIAVLGGGGEFAE